MKNKMGNRRSGNSKIIVEPRTSPNTPAVPTRPWTGWAGMPKTQTTGFIPSAKKEAYTFGLYDMHELVFEWMEDDRHMNYIGAPTTAAPGSRIRGTSSGYFAAVLGRTRNPGTSAHFHGFNCRGKGEEIWQNKNQQNQQYGAL